VIKAICNNFITERCGNETIAVGLNTVREIFARVPAVLHEEGMGDLVQVSLDLEEL
jgi:protein SDA1